MIVVTDPIVITITFVVIVLILIIGGIDIAVHKNQNTTQSPMPPYPAQAAQPIQPQALRITTVVPFTTPVVVSDNETLALRRDYSNQYLRSLIAVYSNNLLIGYIDQTISQTVAPIMDSGVNVAARVLSSTAEQCQVEIFSY